MAKETPFINGLPNLINDLGHGRLIDTKNYAVSAPQATFLKMIVKDVIYNPNYDLLDSKKLTYLQGLGVTNMEYVNVLPRNTIVAQHIGVSSLPMFVFPFFPSHLSLPCKPGECVWVIFDDNNPQTRTAYWLCRVNEIHLADDVNHTHFGRKYETTLRAGAINKAQNTESWHELRNGPVVTIGENRTTSDQLVILKNESVDIFETLISSTDAAKLMSFESVPRFRKRPGDVALEGTNNTLIVLGTDRTGPVASYYDPTTTSDIGSKIAKFPLTEFTSSAGSIDLVAGRGQTLSTSGMTTNTTSVRDANGATKGSILKKELDKSINALFEIDSLNEGDPDLMHDRSRILISQKTSPDKNFSLSNYNLASNSIQDSNEGDAAIVIKSDKVRIIARSDVEFVVTNYTEAKGADDSNIKFEDSNISNWASITIRKNGDIIFKPSSTGYIKLGGDDAKYGVVCSDTAVVSDEGIVTGAQILNTAGGKFAGAKAGVPGTQDNAPIIAGQGKFSSKVLIK